MKTRKSLIFFCLISITLFAPPAFADKTTGHGAVVWLPIAKAKILTGSQYFPTTLRTIQQAKESILAAMYLINVAPALEDGNPASILLESLISAKKRGLTVKVILDDSQFSINYNAYKRLKQSGVDVSFDTPQKVLHAKGIVIDSKTCILGSFNWTRASLEDNYEFAALIEGPSQAKELLDYISKIGLSPGTPIQPENPQGPKFPVSLLISSPEPLLFKLFTDQSEKALDLYLYLLKKAQTQNSSQIQINYEEFAKALGYTENYYRNVIQPLRKLIGKFGLIQRNFLSKELTLKYIPSRNYITIPDAYWDYGFYHKLSFAAKYMYLISLNEAQESGRNPYWFRSNKDLTRIYHISGAPITHAIDELEQENILEVYRQRPDESGGFLNRLANRYRLNPLQSPGQFAQALNALSSKYGADLTAKAHELSGQLNEPNDLEKIQTYIELINTYGYEKVREVNSKVASYHRESGFRGLSQVILLLKGN